MAGSPVIPPFTLDPAVDNYAVMGNPVAHSKSPRIHAAFAAQTGQRLHYSAVPVEIGGFDAALDAFQRQGGRGLNVTLPFKGDAWRLMDHRTPRAERAGSVNTIWFAETGVRHGDTTDGVGLVRDLARLGVTLSGRAVLFLGAGGAVAGVLGDVLEQAPARVVVANRTLSRGEELRERYARMAPIVEPCGYPDLAGRSFDVVINGTSLGLQGGLPPLPGEGLLAAGACCYDMVYADSDTPFVTWARSQDAAVASDGLGMLVEQAAESFFIWRGVRPETTQVIRMLRSS